MRPKIIIRNDVTIITYHGFRYYVYVTIDYCLKKYLNPFLALFLKNRINSRTRSSRDAFLNNVADACKTDMTDESEYTAHAIVSVRG